MGHTEVEGAATLPLTACPGLNPPVSRSAFAPRHLPSAPLCISGGLAARGRPRLFSLPTGPAPGARVRASHSARLLRKALAVFRLRISTATCSLREQISSSLPTPSSAVLSFGERLPFRTARDPFLRGSFCTLAFQVLSA